MKGFVLWIVAFVGFGVLFGGVWWYQQTQTNSSPLVISQTQTSESETIIQNDKGKSDNSVTLMVEVRGAVNNPGVYSFEIGSRIEDAVILAGGYQENADMRNLPFSRADYLEDTLVIDVPFVGETITETVGVLSNSAPSCISINSSSQSDLDSLPGIGEVRSHAIISNRPYTSLGEIISKANVPNSVFSNIESMICL